jgi:hypothetical protein
MSFNFKKDSRFVKLFDEAIRENRYHIRRIYRKYWMPIDNHLSQKCKHRQDPTPLCELFCTRI